MSDAPDPERERPRTSKPWPRLSETLPHRGRGRAACGNCNSTEKLRVWQEHDEKDVPEIRFIVLCDPCGDKIVNPHVRLYARLDSNAPTPGAMELCVGCTSRLGYVCTSAKTHGGAGINIMASKPLVAFVDGVKNGRRFGYRMAHYSFPPSSCSGRDAKRNE